MKYVLGKNTTANLETLIKSGIKESAVLVSLVKEFIGYTPIDFCILENGGYRTAEMQRSLYDAGNSKCDGVKYKSEHQSGLAVDLVPWVNGRATWEKRAAFYLSGAFTSFCRQRGVDITTGADWSGSGIINDSNSWDPCHFQIHRFL